MKKWTVKFETSTSTLTFTETVEAETWQYAEAKLKARYSGVKIKQYSPLFN
jgi:hypothetical protein